jgi:hypothetical protein
MEAVRVLPLFLPAARNTVGGGTATPLQEESAMLRRISLCAGLFVAAIVAATFHAPFGAAQTNRTPADEGDNPFGEAPPVAKSAAKTSAPAVRASAPAARPAGKVVEVKPAAKPSHPAAAGRRLRTGEEAILQAMEENAAFEFSETPFQDVVDYIQDKHRVAIRLDKKALTDGGFDFKTPITCSISGVPLRSALRLMLSDLQLRWTVWCDVVLITTPERAESEELMVTKIYDVSDLIIDAQDKHYHGNALPGISVGEPAAPVTPAWGSMGSGGSSGSGGTGGMGGGMGGLFAVPQETNAPDSSSSPRSKLLPTVISCIPVVGAAEQNGAGTPSASSPTPRVNAQTLPSCCGMMGVGMGSSGYTREENGMSALTDAITTTIQTKTWADNGGTGTISSKGKFLCINQTFQVQCDLKAFLTELRTRRQAAPTIAVELQWLWLDAAQYELLLGGGAKPSGDGPARLAVDAKALDALVRKAPGFRGRILAANGQLVYLASGDRRSIVVNTIPVIGSGVGYSPVVQVPNMGIIVEVRPVVAPGAATATLDVQSAVTRFGKPRKTIHVGASWPASQIIEGSGTKGGAVHGETSVDPAGSGSCPVERPVLPAQELSTTARVPLGKPVMLGGMTFAPNDSAGLDKASDNPLQLYLIATTSIATPAP